MRRETSVSPLDDLKGQVPRRYAVKRSEVVFHESRGNLVVIRMSWSRRYIVDVFEDIECRW